MRQEFAPRGDKAAAARRRRAREERYEEEAAEARRHPSSGSDIARAAERWLARHPADSFGR